MSKQNLIKLLSITLLTIMSLSCSMMGIEEKSGDISLNIPEARNSSRTQDPITYKVTLINSDDQLFYDEEITNSTVEIKHIPLGKYKLYVEGQDKTYYYSGVTDVTIKPGKNPVEITLSYELLATKVFTDIVDDKYIKLTVPKFTNSNVVSITRTEVSTGYSTYIGATTDNTNIINDYFITPNEEYTYKIDYLDIDYLPIHTVTAKATAPSLAIGNVTFDKNITASFDQNNGTITFSEIPSISEKQQKFLNDNQGETSGFAIHYDVEGEVENKGAFTTGIEKTINVAELLQSLPNRNLFDQNLKLTYIKTRLGINETLFEFTMPINELDGLSSIKTINVKNPDPRPATTLRNDARGIEISLLAQEGVPTAAVNCVIIKKNSRTNEYSSMYTPNFVKTTGGDINKITSFIDYFVSPNTEYSYSIEYRDNSNQIIKSTKFNSITAANGSGDYYFNIQNGDITFSSTTLSLNKPITIEPNAAIKENNGVISSIDLKYGKQNEKVNETKFYPSFPIPSSPDVTYPITTTCSRDTLEPSYLENTLYAKEIKVNVDFNGVTFEFPSQDPTTLSKLPTILVRDIM